MTLSFLILEFFLPKKILKKASILGAKIRSKKKSNCLKILLNIEITFQSTNIVAPELGLVCQVGVGGVEVKTHAFGGHSKICIQKREKKKATLIMMSNANENFFVSYILPFDI